jgi:solute carrier family 6 (neurotransmitter transporter, glycine) member 5/9
LPFVTKGGLYLLQIFDWYASSIAVIFICLVEMVMIRWIYGINNFVRDVEFMIGEPVGRYFLLCWKYVTPFLLIVIFTMTVGFSQIWVQNFGLVLSLTPIAIIPMYVGYQLWQAEGSVKEVSFPETILAGPEI